MLVKKYSRYAVYRPRRRYYGRRYYGRRYYVRRYYGRR